LCVVEDTDATPGKNILKVVVIGAKWSKVEIAPVGRIRKGRRNVFGNTRPEAR